MKQNIGYSMSNPRFYQNKALDLGEHTLDEMASHHISHVLRLKIGANLVVFNGNGHEFAGVLQQVNKKTVTVLLQNSTPVTNESNLKLHLVQSISKRDHMDLTLQKAVELGATEITPIISDFCNIKQNAREFHHKQSHWQQIIISATQQCGRAVLTKLNPIISFQEALTHIQAEQRLILSPRAHDVDNTLFTSKLKSVALFIGCEGGFSPIEEETAATIGLTPIALGPRILRTETAAIAALSILQYCLGDLMSGSFLL